jgi:hypothetical protein
MYGAKSYASVAHRSNVEKNRALSYRELVNRPWKLPHSAMLTKNLNAKLLVIA